MTIPKAGVWHTPDRRRFFLVPDEAAMEPGETKIQSLDGHDVSVAPGCLVPLEISEEQARRLVKEQCGQALTELRKGLNEKIGDWRKSLEAFNHRPVDDDTTITPEAPGAILDLFRELPRIVGQSVSGDESRVGAARDAMRKLQQRLKDAGIDVGDRMSDFPDRLARLRQAPKEPHKG